MDVVRDADLTLYEKCAILASGASDACAVAAAPELRLNPAGQLVRCGDIMDALRVLDREAEARATSRADGHPRCGGATAAGARAGAASRTTVCISVEVARCRGPPSFIAPRAWLRERSRLHALTAANDNDAPEPPPIARARIPVPGRSTIVDAGDRSNSAPRVIAGAA